MTGVQTCALPILETSSYERKIREKNNLLRKQARLLAVTEEQEKEKLAKDLHDGVGQSLSALKVILHLNKAQAEKAGSSALAKNAEKAADLADTSLKEMRNVLNNLRPEALKTGGLMAGLRFMADNLNKIDGFTCILETENELPSFDDTVELNLYRLVQEALTNVVKHANAKNAWVTCCQGTAPGRYRFIVKDDGDGFDTESAHGGVGIASMNDRLNMLGGSFQIHSREGAGTEVIMEVPINE